MKLITSQNQPRTKYQLENTHIHRMDADNNYTKCGRSQKTRKKRAVFDRSVLKRFYIISLLCSELRL